MTRPHCTSLMAPAARVLNPDASRCSYSTTVGGSPALSNPSSCTPRRVCCHHQAAVEPVGCRPEQRQGSARWGGQWCGDSKMPPGWATWQGSGPAARPPEQAAPGGGHLSSLTLQLQFRPMLCGFRTARWPARRSSAGAGKGTRAPPGLRQQAPGLAPRGRALQNRCAESDPIRTATRHPPVATVAGRGDFPGTGQIHVGVSWRTTSAPGAAHLGLRPGCSPHLPRVQPRVRRHEVRPGLPT